MEEVGKGSAATKRNKFRRTGGSKNAGSWSSSAGSGSAQTCSLISSLLADISSEVLLEDDANKASNSSNASTSSSSAAAASYPIRAASIRALVRLCVQSFDAKGEVREELSFFPKTLFLMHQWFHISSFQLLFLLVSNWEDAGALVPCHDPRCSHSNTTGPPGGSSESSSSNSSSMSSSITSSLPVCRTQRFKAQVVFALRFWICNFGNHFALNETLQGSVISFRERLTDPKEAGLIDFSSIPSYEWMRNTSVRAEFDGTRPCRKVSLIFNHLEPDEMALHLTFLEHKIIRRISFEDLKNYAESGTLEDVPKLERSVSLFNGLSQWIQCVVLSRLSPPQRADVIVKFVHVAKNLRKLQNFNSLMGVVGSLSHSALARLTKTMECVPVEERKALTELTALVSSSGNFSAYRKALLEAKGFKIPILGVHLKDLISLHTALPDYVEGGLINFRKMSQLSNIFSVLDNLTQCMSPSQANSDLLNTLKASLDLAYSEDEIYELSLSREPKPPVSPTRSPNNSGGGGGGGGGSSSSSATAEESNERQVQMMVDAVFRNYDLDHDGFISREEFQQICTHHPAIDSFFVLDENRDGMISKPELEKYLKAKRDMGIRHSFHEQTYFKPTFCIHCSGLLWGIIRQGYKCRNCGANAHKYCKEYLLHECKPGPLLHLPSPEPHPKRRGFRIRKKSSSQSESGSPPSPKLFASLEQLSWSLESYSFSDLPPPTSRSFSHTDHYNVSSSSPKSSSIFNNPLKSPRRLSYVLGASVRRSSSSVPSSPKLGFNLPGSWTPCKNFFHSSVTPPSPNPSQGKALPPPSELPSTSKNLPSSSSSQSSSSFSFVSRAGQGWNRFFGGTPTSSPKHSSKTTPKTPGSPSPSSSRGGGGESTLSPTHHHFFK